MSSGTILEHRSENIETVLAAVMDTANEQGLGQQPDSQTFPTRFPSRRSSMEMTEMIPGSSEGLNSSRLMLKHVGQAVSGNIERVGPWPLKRGGSSDTAILQCEGVKPSRTQLTYSELMDAFEQYYGQVNGEGEKGKLASDEIFEILERNKRHVNGPTAGEIQVANNAEAADMESRSVLQRDRPPGGDTERHAGEVGHVLGSCCQQCRSILAEKESAASIGFWVVFACFLVLVLSAALIVAMFSRDGKAMIIDVQGNSEKTLRLFTGLLIIPAVAVYVLIASALWSLLLHFGFPPVNLFERQANINMVMWFGL